MTWLLLVLLLPTTASLGPLLPGEDLAVQQANQTDDDSNQTAFFQKIAAAFENPWITGSLLVLACAAAVLAQRLARRRR